MVHDHAKARPGEVDWGATSGSFDREASSTKGLLTGLDRVEPPAPRERRQGNVKGRGSARARARMRIRRKGKTTRTINVVGRRQDGCEYSDVKG